ncbi:MAG: hypothetical protein K0S74_186 [Chlamydiales bacterium]|jgi:diphosphomevalonate decarboxylase|nr:hypothetical protein [Chlamydiales bacterium]
MKNGMKLIKQQMIQKLLPQRFHPRLEEAHAFAPAHLHLCKAWGLRNKELNLPIAPSISLSLPFGSNVCVQLGYNHDSIRLNEKLGISAAPEIEFFKQILDLVRPYPDFYFTIIINDTISDLERLTSNPLGSKIAALLLALRDFFDWKLDRTQLCILTRILAGEACISLYSGFVEWDKGVSPNGWDSYASPLSIWWDELLVGHLPLSTEKAKRSQQYIKEAQLIQETSSLYTAWEAAAIRDVIEFKEALNFKQFERVGQVSENNGLTLQALALSSIPTLLYCSPQTIECIHEIWRIRNSGIPLYFTMDQSADLKILFLEKDLEKVKKTFPKAEIFIPFNSH